MAKSSGLKRGLQLLIAEEQQDQQEDYLSTQQRSNHKWKSNSEYSREKLQLMVEQSTVRHINHIDKAAKYVNHSLGKIEYWDLTVLTPGNEHVAPILRRAINRKVS